MSGWITLHRKMRENPLFKKNKPAMLFFIQILMDAAWRDTVQDWRGQPVDVRRGQLMMSVREMCETYDLTRQNVRTLLNHLKSHEIVKFNQVTNKAPYIITVCNYDKYQESQPSANPSPNQAPTKRQPIKEQENNTNNLNLSRERGRENEMNAALNPGYGDSGVIVHPDRSVELINGTKAKWLERFDGNEDRLALALEGFEIQENSRTLPEAQVSRFLARQAGDRMDRDRRYEQAKAKPSASPHQSAARERQDAVYAALANVKQ